MHPKNVALIQTRSFLGVVTKRVPIFLTMKRRAVTKGSNHSCDCNCQQAKGRCVVEAAEFKSVDV